MDSLLLIIACCLAFGVLVFTIIMRYATQRTVRVLTVVLAFAISVPVLGFCLYVLISGQYNPQAEMWALGCCGILAGFWLKTPLREIKET